MVNPTDPNKVLMTGENSFIRLQLEEDGPQITRASHWRVLLSPGGPGHVLFIMGDVTNDEVRIYTDNIAMTRWLQGEIESYLFHRFGDQDIPIIDSLFSRSGDHNTFWTESVESVEDTVVLTWYDFEEPYVLRSEPGSVEGRPHGVYSCFLPAKRTQLTLNGMVARGRPFPEMRGDRQSSTACLAWSETWVTPY